MSCHDMQNTVLQVTVRIAACRLTASMLCRRRVSQATRSSGGVAPQVITDTRACRLDLAPHRARHCRQTAGSTCCLRHTCGGTV